MVLVGVFFGIFWGFFINWRLIVIEKRNESVYGNKTRWRKIDKDNDSMSVNQSITERGVCENLYCFHDYVLNVLRYF